MTRVPALRQYPTCLDLPEDAPRTRRAWAGGFPDGCLAVGSPISPKLASGPKTEIDNLGDSAKYILSFVLADQNANPVPRLASRGGVIFLLSASQKAVFPMVAQRSHRPALSVVELG